jgi:hypothetical protein
VRIYGSLFGSNPYDSRMINFRFDKATAQRLLDALANGNRIAPTSADGWTRDEMLMLAGVLFHGAMSHGPLVVPGEDASDQEFFQDLNDAIEFYSKLTMLVADDEYDASGFAPSCSAVIQRQRGAKTIAKAVGMPAPASGFWRVATGLRLLN